MDKISKSQLKMVRSLQQKKFRDELGLFVAEGEKCVSELLKSFDPELLIVSTDYQLSIINCQLSILSASPTEIEQMSSLRTPQGVIGVFHKHPSQLSIVNSQLSIVNSQLSIVNSQLLIALDGIQDPGNLGTIIRTCDWFGVHDIVCSLDTADCYNPKVVQATMGALSRVRVHYVNLPAWLESLSPSERGAGGVPNIFGTLLEGKNMYDVHHRHGQRGKWHLSGGSLAGHTSYPHSLVPRECRDFRKPQCLDCYRDRPCRVSPNS